MDGNAISVMDSKDGLERAIPISQILHGAEQIVMLPRQTEVLMSQWKTASAANRETGISRWSFYSRRKHHNMVRAHY